MMVAGLIKLDFELLKQVYQLIMKAEHPPPITSLEHAPQPIRPPRGSPNVSTSHLLQPGTSSSAKPSVSLAEATTIQTDPLPNTPQPVSPGTTFKDRQIGIYKQGEFVRKFGGKEMMNKLKTRDGGNLVEGMYKNARIMF
jgi:hypothetical protein